MKCHGCGKEIWKEEPFQFEQENYHVDCIPKAIRLSRRNAQRKKIEREQQKLRWN